MDPRALGTVLVGLAIAAGCSGAPPPESAAVTLSRAESADARPSWRRSAVRCRADGNRPALLEGVTTAVPLDAIELRRGRSPDAPGELFDARGEVCAVLDAPACEAARRRLAPDDGFLHQCDPGTCFHYLLLRRGDRLAVAPRLDDVVKLLAPIDTEHDALLLAWASGYHVACRDNELDGEIEQMGSGFRYTTEDLTGLCPPATSRIVIDVTRAGVVTEVSRRVVRQGTGCIRI